MEATGEEEMTKQQQHDNYHNNKALTLELCQQKDTTTADLMQAFGFKNQVAGKYLTELLVEGYLTRKPARTGSTKFYVYRAVNNNTYIRREAKLPMETYHLPESLTEYLARMFGYTQITPPKGMHILESHASWIGKSYSGHIGSGSCAMLETA
jgi:hypothetical protein